jgi:hypothetical protein
VFISSNKKKEVFIYMNAYMTFKNSILNINVWRKVIYIRKKDLLISKTLHGENCIQIDYTLWGLHLNISEKVYLFKLCILESAGYGHYKMVQVLNGTCTEI